MHNSAACAWNDAKLRKPPTSNLRMHSSMSWSTSGMRATRVWTVWCIQPCRGTFACWTVVLHGSPAKASAGGGRATGASPSLAKVTTGPSIGAPARPERGGPSWPFPSRAPSGGPHPADRGRYLYLLGVMTLNEVVDLDLDKRCVNAGDSLRAESLSPCYRVSMCTYIVMYSSRIVT